ncbi:hypothetical protein KFL_000230370, partial [Klebsormidium nitens]
MRPCPGLFLWLVVVITLSALQAVRGQGLVLPGTNLCLFTDEDTCQKSQQCSWVTECEPLNDPCKSYSNKGSCNLCHGCVWDQFTHPTIGNFSYGTCSSISCQLPSYGDRSTLACLALGGKDGACHMTGKCVYNGCSDASDQCCGVDNSGRCGGIPNCNWESLCVLRNDTCAGVVSQTQCDNTIGCQWRNSAGHGADSGYCFNVANPCGIERRDPTACAAVADVSGAPLCRSEYFCNSNRCNHAFECCTVDQPATCNAVTNGTCYWKSYCLEVWDPCWAHDRTSCSQTATCHWQLSHVNATLGGVCASVSAVCPLELDDPAQCNALVDPSTGRQMCRSQGACNHDECYEGDKCCGVHDEDTCTARGSCDWNPYCELIIDPCWLGSFSRPECVALEGCSWRPLAGGGGDCMSTVSPCWDGNANERACNNITDALGTRLCRYEGSCSETTCQDDDTCCPLSAPTECNAEDACVWETYCSLRYDFCANWKTKADCSAIATCLWEGSPINGSHAGHCFTGNNACRLGDDDPDVCTAIVDGFTGEPLCHVAGHCIFDHCDPHDQCCYQHNQVDCAAAGTQCSWAPQCNLRWDPCWDLLDDSACALAPSCHWLADLRGNGTVAGGCYSISNPCSVANSDARVCANLASGPFPLCRASGSCYNSGCKPGDICCGPQNEADCVARSPQCVFDDSCEIKTDPCHGVTTRNACLSTGPCAWDDSYAYCHYANNPCVAGGSPDVCGRITDLSTGASLCQWRTACMERPGCSGGTCPPAISPCDDGVYYVCHESELRAALGTATHIVIVCDIQLSGPLPPIATFINITGKYMTPPCRQPSPSPYALPPPAKPSPSSSPAPSASSQPSPSASPEPSPGALAVDVSIPVSIPVSISVSIGVSIFVSIPVSIHVSISGSLLLSLPFELPPTVSKRGRLSFCLPLHVSTAVHVTPGVSFDVTPAVSFLVSTTLRLGVPSAVSFDVSATVSFDVSAAVSFDVSATVSFDVSPTIPFDVSTSIPLDVSTAVTLNVSTAVTLNVSTAVAIDVSAAFTLYVGAAVTLDVISAVRFSPHERQPLSEDVSKPVPLAFRSVPFASAADSERKRLFGQCAGVDRKREPANLGGGSFQHHHGCEWEHQPVWVGVDWGGGSGSFSNVVFSNNNAGASGAAVFINNGNGDFSDCVFVNNTAMDSGGAVYVHGTTTFQQTQFVGNAANQSGGAIILDQQSGSSFVGCSFQDNSALDSGGAIHVDHTSTVNSTYTQFLNNNASTGGDLYNRGYRDSQYSGQLQFCPADVGAQISGALSTVFPTDCAPPVIPIGRGIYIVSTPAQLAYAINQSAADILLVSDVTLFAPLPIITSDVTIHGLWPDWPNPPLAARIRISGLNTFRIFYVRGAKLTVANLDLYGGYSGDNGGAVYIENLGASTGSGEFTNVGFVQNSALGNGSAVYMVDGNAAFESCDFVLNAASGSGGAVWVYGMTTFLFCRFVGNTAQNAGGAVVVPQFAEAGFAFTQLRNNTCLGGPGGAVYGELSSQSGFNNCTFAGNRASNATGPDLFLVDSPSEDQLGRMELCPLTCRPVIGGAVAKILTKACGIAVAQIDGVYYVTSETDFVSALNNNAKKVVITSNVQLSGPLPTVTADVIVTGAPNPAASDGKFVLLAAPGYGIFRALGADVSIANLTLTGGLSNSTGGAVSITDGWGTFADVTFSYSSARLYGGAVYVTDGGADFVGCVFANNTAGISGGAVFIDGLATFQGCAFSGNWGGSSGGAVTVPTGSLAQVSGSQFTGNYAANVSGGAVLAQTSSYVFIESSTFWGNAAASTGGGLQVNPGGHVRVSNSTFGNNTISQVGPGKGGLSNDLRSDAGSTQTVQALLCACSANLTFDGATASVSVLATCPSSVLPRRLDGAYQVASDWELRTAIAYANVRNGTDTIVVTADIVLQGPLPAITNSVQIVGVNISTQAGPVRPVSVSGNGLYRIFTVRGIPFFLDTLILADGKAFRGSALYAKSGTGTLRNVVFFDGRSTYNGGAVEVRYGRLQLWSCLFDGNTAGVYGGALFAERSIVSGSDCEFSSNRAGDSGGGFAGHDSSSAQFATTFFTNNTAQLFGGGLSIGYKSNAKLTRSTFSLNVAFESGADFYARDFPGTASDGGVDYCPATTSLKYGGAVYRVFRDSCDPPPPVLPSGGTFLITTEAQLRYALANGQYDIVLETDIAMQLGPLPTVTANLVLSGSPDFSHSMGRPPMISAGYSSQILTISGGTVLITGLEFNAGNSTEEGGAVRVIGGATVTFREVIFSENLAWESGGAVFVDNDGKTSADFMSCVFFNNTAFELGGAVFAEGNVNLTDCSFQNNTAAIAGGAAALAVTSVGDFFECSFVGNTAYDKGGAIYVDPRATVILSACTFAYDSAHCVLGGDDLFLRGLLLPVYGSVGVAGTAFICPNPSTLKVAGSSLNLVFRDCPPPVIPFVSGAFRVSTEAQLRYAMSQGDWIILDADVVLTSPLPVVRSQLRLTGGACSAPRNGTCRFSISGGNAFRIFRVQSSELWLENLLLVGGWGQPTIGHVADSDGSGGAVSLTNSVGTFVNVVFANHNATGNGGAVFATGGSVNFARCLFTGNKAGASGGALYLDSVITMVNCTVTKNTAGGDGGAVSLAVSSTGHFSGCLFDSNVAGLTAGAIYTGPKATSRFDLCAFTNNVAQDGLDMYIKAFNIPGSNTSNGIATYCPLPKSFPPLYSGARLLIDALCGTDLCAGFSATSPTFCAPGSLDSTQNCFCRGNSDCARSQTCSAFFAGGNCTRECACDPLTGTRGCSSACLGTCVNNCDTWAAAGGASQGVPAASACGTSADCPVNRICAPVPGGCKVCSCDRGTGVAGCMPCGGTCQAVKPFMTGAKMSSDCKSVLVSLNSMPDPNLSGSGCALIFAIATRNLLGSGAVCTITSTTVTVTLGTSATLVPGNTIALLANGLIQAGTGTPFDENVTVTVDWPDNPPLPIAVISGPTLVGARCAAVNAATAVVLDASLSSDPSGRPLGKYYWTLASAPDVVSLMSAHDEVAAQQGATQLWLDSRDLGPGNYTVALTVASFLGQMTNTSWTFTRTADPIPVMSVVGANPRSIKLPVATILQTAVVYAPLCGAASQLTYQWTFVNGSTNFSMDGLKTNLKDLVIPANTPGVTPGRKYSLALQARVVDTTLGPQFDDPIGYAYVDLVVVPSDVTAVVRGGSRDAVDSEALVLIVDASDPDDPLNLLEAFKIFWRCVDSSGGDCFRNANATSPDASSVVFTVPRYTLKPGVFTFYALAGKGACVNGQCARQATASVTIRIVAGYTNPPIGQILVLQAINPTRPARFQAQVLASSGGPIGYRWVCQNLNLTNPDIATTGQLSQYLAISPAFLEPGYSYTVIVYITDVYTGLVGTASYTIQVPRGPVCNAPSLCLTVTPAQGWDNGLTSYTASLASWATDFPPLSYEIGYVDDDGLEIALVSNSQLPSYTFATLPAGLAANNDTRTVYACVSDAWLSQICVAARVTVKHVDVPPGEVTASCLNALQAALATGDPVAILAATTACSCGLNTLPVPPIYFPDLSPSPSPLPSPSMSAEPSPSASTSPPPSPSTSPQPSQTPSPSPSISAKPSPSASSSASLSPSPPPLPRCQPSLPCPLRPALPFPPSRP